MARKQVTDFDADSFIQSVRESAVPTYHTASDVAPAAATAPEKKPKQKEPVETRRKRRIGESSDFLLKKVSEMNMTEEEGNYVKTYIGNVSFGQVNRNGNPIVVREDYREMIKDIFSMFGVRLNMAAYADAVLTEHFKQCYPLIQGIAEKCPSKF